MKRDILFLCFIGLLPIQAIAKDEAVSDQVVTDQRAALATNTKDKGFGPQSPRDIDAMAGTNTRAFNEAPSYTSMNLCNIHFHKMLSTEVGSFRPMRAMAMVKVSKVVTNTQAS